MRTVARRQRSGLQTLTQQRGIQTSSKILGDGKIHMYETMQAYDHETGDATEVLLFSGNRTQDVHAHMPQLSVVMLQEWWGVNDQLKLHASLLADQGFDVYVPDLYKGTVALEVAEAQHQMETLDWNAAIKEVGNVVQLAKKNGNNAGVGTLGFCMGGGLSLAAAANVPDIDAAVSCYGIAPPSVDMTKLKVPVQCHFGDHDQLFTKAQADQLQTFLNDYAVPHEFWRYHLAGHAFMNGSETASDAKLRGEIGFEYRAPEAEVAWLRISQFLFNNVKESPFTYDHVKSRHDGYKEQNEEGSVQYPGY